MYNSSFILEGKPIFTTVVNLGDDLNVSIGGGSRPHIGAVALAISRASLTDPDRLSATTSVLAVTGHKEDELAKLVAHKLASELGVNVSVSCGIHYDGINEDIAREIEALVELEIDRIKSWVRFRK